jgi:hypothetical protein
MIITSTSKRESAQADRLPGKCPYFDGFGGTCGASFSAMPVDRRRRNGYCASDDHDDCAIYLSKMLRINRPVGFSLQTRELETK